MTNATVRLCVEELGSRILPSAAVPVFSTPVATIAPGPVEVVPVVSTPFDTTSTPPIVVVPVDPTPVDITAPTPVAVPPNLPTPVVTIAPTPVAVPPNLPTPVDPVAPGPIVVSPIMPTPVVTIAPPPIVPTPAVPVGSGPVVSPSHPFHGNGMGQYIGSSNNVDGGVSDKVTGNITLNGFGSFSVTGWVQGTGFITQGRATGELVLQSSEGTINLALHGAVQPGFSPVPRELVYSITGGTGAYQNLKGYGIVNIGFMPAPTAFGLSPQGSLTLSMY